MKRPLKTISLLTASALFALNPLAAVETDPVGYVTVAIEGDGKSSIISNAGLVQSAEVQNTVSVNGMNVTFDTASFDTDEFANSHYFQLSTGEWAPIVGNSSNSLSLEYALPNANSVSATVRPLNTLNSLFGTDNSAGFTAGSGLAQSDIVAIFDQATQNFAGLFYYNSSRDRWEDSSNDAAGSTIVYPDEALIIIGKTAKSITFSGSVQTNATKGSLAGVGDSSLVPNPYPTDLVISESGFEDFITGGPTFAASDKVFVWNAQNQAFDKLYYFDTDDSTWKTASNVAATQSDVVPVGSAALIVKSQSGNDEWSLQQPF